LEADIQFSNESDDASTYLWDFGSREADPTSSSEFNPYVRFNAPNGDTLTVCLTAINGSCEADTCKEVPILNNMTVFMANAFSPNDDGLNDVFYPAGKFHDNPFGSEEYQFLVFNRWGELIFESNMPYEGWDGTYMNNQVQQDVYVWRLDVFDPVDNRTKTYYGTVTLVR
jgi:gliding motility-associated-like protein